MKKYIRLICVLLSVAAFTACEDEDRGLVVSQDTSYQLDPDYVFADSQHLLVMGSLDDVRRVTR